jgi:hypothetical protein
MMILPQKLGSSSRFSIWNIPTTDYLDSLLPPCQPRLTMVSSIPVHRANLHCLVDGFVCLRNQFLYFNDFFRLGIGLLPELLKGYENLSSSKKLMTFGFI